MSTPRPCPPIQKPVFLLILALVLALTADARASAADIVFENARFRAVLGADAVWRSLTAGGRELCATNALPIATVRMAPSEVHGAGSDANVGQQQALMARESAHALHAANRAEFADGRLTLHFEGCDTTLSYDVQTTPDWVLFTLRGVRGTRPAELTLLRFGTVLTAHTGTRLALGWDDAFAVGLQGANLQTRGQGARRPGYTELSATTQDAPGPKFEGAAAALVAAPTPEIDALLQRFAAACGLPRNEADGVSSKKLPLARQSYWFLSFGQRDADQVIDLCRQSGLRQVLLTSSAWCTKPGHYVFNTNNYPDGLASLQSTVAKLHAAGISVNLHCFASKVAKTDAYVTPVPDRRFWADRACALAAAVGPSDTLVRTTSDLREWAGSPVARQTEWEGGVAKHREVIVDDEIIAYDHIGPGGRYDTFLGCTRGAWKTQPAAHAAGAAGRHNAVDGCINGYIIDQETTLLDETTTRLAGIFNACDFDGVYFDGGEDVDRRRFDYYVSKFQAVAIGKFTRRPLVHMGTILTHHLWHSFTRSATVDTYMGTLLGRILAGAPVDQWPTVRDHIDNSVNYMLSVADDRMPGELGWFGIWSKGEHTDGLQMDEIEYLMAKSLAYDTPISLETSFSQMKKHPLTPGLLEIVRNHEEVRAAGTIPAATRAQLRDRGRDFLLLRDGPQPDLVPVAPAEVAGGRDVRALVGVRGNDAIAVVWDYLGREGNLALPGAPANLRRLDVFGHPLPAIRLGPRRTTLVFPNTSPAAVREMLSRAKME